MLLFYKSKWKCYWSEQSSQTISFTCNFDQLHTQVARLHQNPPDRSCSFMCVQPCSPAEGHGQTHRLKDMHLMKLQGSSASSLTL